MRAAYRWFEGGWEKTPYILRGLAIGGGVYIGARISQALEVRDDLLLDAPIVIGCILALEVLVVASWSALGRAGPAS